MQSPATDPLTGLSVDSSAFRRRASRVMLSDDPDTATVQTVQAMCQAIRASVNDPIVQRAARAACSTYKGGPAWVNVHPMVNANSRCRDADSVFWWCKHHLKFRHHSDMFEVWSDDLGDPGIKLQLLIAPDVLVRMRRMEGDCAIYTMMVCAMLAALGIRYQVMPLAVDHRQPEIFTHVCARAVFDDGSSETLDASHGAFPGWQVPNDDVMRMWVFDEGGQRVMASPLYLTGKFTGLHGYRRRGIGGMVCDDSGCHDDGTGTGTISDMGPTDYYNPTQVFGTNLDWGGFSETNGGYAAPSQNSAQWAQFASNLAKMGFTLAQINSIQPGTVVTPTGISRQNPGYAIPTGNIAASIGANSNILLYAGIGIVALIAVGSMFRGRG